MFRSGESAIKLFGRTISFRGSDSEGGGRSEEDEKDHQTNDTTSANNDHSSNSQTDSEEHRKPENSKPDSCVTDDQKPGNSTPEKQPEATSDPDPKALKKPDKILPCPRCHSTDTKFCYYNNYNINQPRHFCKNCQRYWTAGGTMRNVPVGAGRRKSKSTVSRYRQLLGTDQGVLSFSESAETFSTPSSCDERKTSAGASVISAWPYPWAPGFAVPVYWTCTAGPGAWNLPAVSAVNSNCRNDCTKEQGPSCAGDNDETRGISQVKRMRVGDPGEAAKSSVWTIIDRGNGKGDGSKGRGIFEAFRSEVAVESRQTDGFRFLNANPAAFARSVSFHESS